MIICQFDWGDLAHRTHFQSNLSQTQHTEGITSISTVVFYHFPKVTWSSHCLYDRMLPQKIPDRFFLAPKLIKIDQKSTKNSTMKHTLLLLLNLLFCSLAVGNRSPIFISTPQRRSAKLKLTPSARVHYPNHLNILAQHLQNAATISHQHLLTLTSEALFRSTTMTRSITSSPSFPHYIAGIAAGILECLVGHPLDTIRVRIITAGTGTLLFHTPPTYFLLMHTFASHL